MGVRASQAKILYENKHVQPGKNVDVLTKNGYFRRSYI